MSENTSCIGFIVGKILLRTIVSSIVPVTLYSLGFGGLKLANRWDEYNFQMKYFNYVPWAIIGIISALYPLNYIWLWFFFAPLEACANKMIKKHAKKYKGVKGNRAKTNPIL